MQKDFVESDVLKLIKEEVKTSSLRRVAQRLGVTHSYVSDIIWRRRSVSEAVAKKYGFTREKITVVVFRKEG
jgi:plasmid maintenance system antidote protein VapI